MNTNNISSGTIARTIVLAIALFNQVLASTGKIPIEIEEETVYQLLSLIATVIAALAAWWKNNSFTVAAIEGDKVKDAVKTGQMQPGETDHLIHRHQAR